MDIQTARLTEFKHDELTFDVIDSGPIDGQPFILLHGFPETNHSWQQVSTILNQHGFRTFALNQRGYSLGAQPEGRYHYRISKLVSDVKALIDLIGNPVYLMGHDWGSAVAWEVVRSYPQQIIHFTAVSASHTGAFLRAVLTSRQFFKSYYMGLFQLPLVPELLFKNLNQFGDHLLKNTGMTSEQLATFHQEIVSEKRLTPALNWYRAMPYSFNPQILDKVKVPTLFVWGKKDTAIGEKCAEYNHLYVDAPYTEIHLDATHWIPTQNPNELATLVLEDIQKKQAA